MKRVIKDPTYSVYSRGGNVENKNRPIDKEQLMKLAKDEADILFDLENDIIEQMKLDYIKEGGKGQSFTDWLKSKPKSYLRNIPLQMSKGGKVIMLSDYLKQKEPIKIKKINLDAAAPGKTLFDLTDAEREVVNKLLRMSFGRDE
jgi:PleD family two-component response regulator